MHVRLFVVSLLAASVAFAAQPQKGRRVSAGDYAATLSVRGVVVEHKGKPITLGSYFAVYHPEYKGTYATLSDGWKKGTVHTSADGRTVTMEAALPQARCSYAVTVSEKGVTTTARVTIPDDVAKGPVEYAAFQFPTTLIEGATVDVLNVSGTVIDRKPIPAVGKRGAMARRGDALLIKTAERTLVVSSASGIGIHPFDARVKRYGSRQGLWAFSSIPVAPGQEGVAVVNLRVQPPEPPRVAGTIRIAPDVAATAVATVPDACAREQLAAQELIDHLARITGRPLPLTEIADKTVPKGVVAIGRLATDAGLIARKELDAVERDGYLVRVADGRVAIAGWRDLGAIYGVYALLQHLGCRFYAPGCEVVPTIPNLTIPACELRAKPFYEFRKVTQNLKLGHTPSDDLGNPREIGEKGGLVHAAAYLLPYDKYGKDHPEYFALQKDGKRLHRDPKKRRFDVHLCLSNPDVRRISAERLLALIEKQPDRTFFGVSQGDGHAWCQCAKCKALDAVPGKEMTDRLIDYVNAIAREVAKKYPDKRILTLAYTNATSPPPVRVRPEPNVMVQFCPYPHRVACQSHFLDCPKNAKGFADIKGWLAKCPNNMYVFDYPRGYKIWYEPFGSFYAMKRKLDFYAAHGIRGLYYCGVPTNFRDLFIFVQSRLLWEPKADVEKLIDEFMPAYYGPAAPHVRAYFDYMHREVEERQVHQMCEGPNPGLVTAAYARKALDLLAKAEAAVADDRARRYRVRTETFCVLFADLNERNPMNDNLAESEAEFARRLAEFCRIGRSHRIYTVGRRESGIVSDWFHRIARIRTRVNPWYADSLVRRLIADPAKTLASERKLYCQTKVPGGWRLAIDGFRGGHGPADYDYNCPLRRAVWIYGTNRRQRALRTTLFLERAPKGKASLALVAQDDDKPGAVRIRIAVNGKPIFEGSNPFKEKAWSRAEFPIPAGLLRRGENDIRIATLDPSKARDQGWFMVAECIVLQE